MDITALSNREVNELIARAKGWEPTRTAPPLWLLPDGKYSTLTNWAGTMAFAWRLAAEMGLDDGWGLISDDAGSWAYVGDGFQDTKDPDDPESYVRTATFFVLERTSWQRNAQRAICQAWLARDEECRVDGVVTAAQAEEEIDAWLREVNGGG